MPLRFPACIPALWPLLLILLCAHGMTGDTIRSLRRDTRDLFYHGFTNYMRHAFPDDELKPISCKPQTRNRENPADIGLNDVLGNYSVTLVDSLSSLAILASGERGEDKHRPLKDFQEGVAALVELYGDGGEKRPCGTKACGFELDSKVQVFETNIRGVGGLLSAHLFAVGELPIRGYEPKWVKGKDGGQVIKWPKFAYDGQLLRLAHDLASRLLPAFGTQTGLPYPRVNLKHGIPFYRDSEDGICRLDGTSSDPREITETCAAGAGSLVLEFTTLSRLTGDERFEILAKRAFWAVWERRSAIGLLGNGLDAENGQWTLPPLSGIGAGIDSFFEYAVKSSILLSGLPNPSTAHPLDAPESFLRAWEEAHAAVKRHVRRSPTSERHPYYGQADLLSGAPRYSWIDNLSAYYPGLLSLAGELDEAIESHLLFAALWTRYGALPERWHAHNAFIDPNFRHWVGRPEFIESTYYLYQATKDPFYLHVGEMTLRDIRRRCWTPCGWADLSDVVSGEQRDRQESFFLGETAKYLYLLFQADHPLNKMDAPVVFSTEGHPLMIPPRLRSGQPGQNIKPTKTSIHAPVVETVPAPTCPARQPSDPFTNSPVVSRHDFFHAAALAQLHLVPVQQARSSSLHEASNDGPAISIEDIRSPTNYTYYPCTLPQSLVPEFGFSSAINSPVVSTLTFPNMNIGDIAAEKGLIPFGSLQKVMDGIVINSLSNLRLNMVQEPRSLLLPDGDGVLVQMEVGQQYRVQGIANWALGRDEKVLLAQEALDGVAPGDPNFKRVKDLEMVDLVVDFVPPAPPSHDDGSDFNEWDTEVTLSENNTQDASIWSDIESMVTSLLSGSTHQPSTTASSSHLTLSRTILPAILPTGAGAAPLPPQIDSGLDPLKLPRGALSFPKIYFLASTLCTFRLPTHIAREYQILIIQRGECSFNDKLANIPAYAPAPEALQLVVVVSPPSPDELIRPLLDERQKTPAGFERRHGVAMVMVEGNDGATEALVGAATVVGEVHGDGEIVEDRLENGPFEGIAKGRGKGLGVKRKFWFESMGYRIDNLIPL